MNEHYLAHGMTVRLPTTSVAWLALLLSWIIPAVGAAQDTSPAVEEGRRALDGWNDYPWYDDQADDLRPLSVEPPAAPNNPAPPANWSGAANTIQVLAWIALAVLLAVVVWMLISHFISREEQTAQKPVEQVAAADRVRIEALPFPVAHADGDLLAQCRSHYQTGQYGDAMVCLYSHMLLQLDRVHLILLTRGKTNRQYLREARRAGAVGGHLEPVMVAFEDYYFGHHALDRVRFDHCWNQLDAFHHEIQQAED